MGMGKTSFFTVRASSARRPGYQRSSGGRGERERASNDAREGKEGRARTGTGTGFGERPRIRAHNCFRAETTAARKMMSH
jgi:hypothetical protein